MSLGLDKNGKDGGNENWETWLRWMEEFKGLVIKTHVAVVIGVYQERFVQHSLLAESLGNTTGGIL